jgi:hypothetical protein
VAKKTKPTDQTPSEDPTSSGPTDPTPAEMADAGLLPDTGEASEAEAKTAAELADALAKIDALTAERDQLEELLDGATSLKPLDLDHRAIPPIEDLVEAGFNRNEAETVRAGMELAARGPSPDPDDTEGRIAVVFHGSWTKYNPGEVAGFDPHVVSKLEGMKTMDSKGNKGPLISRYKKPVLERLGITKGAGPKRTAPTPVGGTDEGKVIGTDSPELIGGPAHRKP